MTVPVSPYGPGSEEKTFRSYTKDQGANYAQHRPNYHTNLYKVVLEQHISTGGQLNTLLDVGCGPGLAARGLAPNFVHVIGLDPSEGMINSARSIAGTSSTSEPIRYEISAAEELGSNLSPPLDDASVDLITASTAAHWFDMTRFWPQAARVLKPGGSVAIWALAHSGVDPSMPNAAAIQAALDNIEEKDLTPYFEAGNWMTKNLYVDLPLPWTVTPPVAEFDKDTFFRKQWGPGDNQDLIEGGEMTIDMDTMEKVLATSSPVQRWREAHPETAGTEKDVVRRMRREIERLLHEAGAETEGKVLKGAPNGVLLIAKKKA